MTLPHSVPVKRKWAKNVKTLQSSAQDTEPYIFQCKIMNILRVEFI